LQSAHPPGCGRQVQSSGGGGGLGGLHLRRGPFRPAGPRRRAAAAAADAGAAGGVCGIVRHHGVLRLRAHDGGDCCWAREDMRQKGLRPTGHGRQDKQAGAYASGRRVAWGREDRDGGVRIGSQRGSVGGWARVDLCNWRSRPSGPQRARQAGADAGGPASLCPRIHLRRCRWRMPLGSRDSGRRPLHQGSRRST